MEERPETRPGGEESRSLDELERMRRRESLESSRRGVVRELEATKSDLRRRSLEAALQHLDDELQKLSG